MGYENDFIIPVSDTQAYRQFGNSVVVPVVKMIANEVAKTLCQPIEFVPDLVLQFAEKNKKEAYKTTKKIKKRTKK